MQSHLEIMADIKITPENNDITNCDQYHQVQV